MSFPALVIHDITSCSTKQSIAGRRLQVAHATEMLRNMACQRRLACVGQVNDYRRLGINTGDATSLARLREC
jgi:hypothetical protein